MADIGIVNCNRRCRSCWYACASAAAAAALVKRDCLPLTRDAGDRPADVHKLTSDKSVVWYAPTVDDRCSPNASKTPTLRSAYIPLMTSHYWANAKRFRSILHTFIITARDSAKLYFRFRAVLLERKVWIHLT